MENHDLAGIGSAGTVRRQAVDVSPLRRVNQAIWLLCTGAREASFRNIKTIAECLADELINAAKVRRACGTNGIANPSLWHLFLRCLFVCST
jgi:ribosomal protein S7